MQFFIARHGQSVGNATGIFDENADALTELGHEQARNLCRHLTKLSFDKVVVSPLTRALETAAPFVKTSDTRGEIWPEIAEGCYHPEREVPAPSWDREERILPDHLVDHYDFRDGKALNPINTTFGMGLRRAIEAKQLLEGMRVEEFERVLVVMHEHMIRELLYLCFSPQDFPAYHHDNCHLTVLEYRGEWSLLHFNQPAGIAVAGGD